MYPILPLLLILFLQILSTRAGLVTPANVFSGCQTKLPGGQTQISYNNNPNGFTSSQQCNSECAKTAASSGNNKSYFQASTNTCYCSSRYNSPPESAYGNADTCDAANFDTRLITTSFHLVGCYTTMPGGLSSVAKTGPNGCLNTCAKTTQAGFYMGNDPTTYPCYCGAGSYTTQTQCGPGAYFVYQHSLADASAGLGRRKRQERYDREQKKYIPCPNHMTACIIEGHSQDTYECVDTENDIESCGGCRHGTYRYPNATVGQDCSNGAALSHSTCTAGHCHTHRCKRGFTLSKGSCVRNRVEI